MTDKRRPSHRTEDRLKWTQELVRLVTEEALLETLDLPEGARQSALVAVRFRIDATVLAMGLGKPWPTERGRP